MARLSATMPFNILLQGESGTGKELFAQSIHNACYANEDRPFVSINCGAIPTELIESELFGYEKGAFTGALQSGKPGKLQLAENGTLFLDEISSMPLSMQVKLLRALQNRCFTRIGGVDEVPFDTKIISASNRDLANEVRRGNFREDLYFRIHVIDIFLPPLRENPDDIPLLAQHFLEKICQASGVSLTLHPSALEPLLKYDWPGNIRELENTIEKLVVLAIANKSHTIRLHEIKQCSCFSALHFHDRQQTDIPQEAFLSLADNEQILIEKTLKMHDGNKTKTAEALGITRKTLYKKIHDYNIVV